MPRRCYSTPPRVSEPARGGGGERGESLLDSAPGTGVAVKGWGLETPAPPALFPEGLRNYCSLQGGHKRHRANLRGACDMGMGVLFRPFLYSGRASTMGNFSANKPLAHRRLHSAFSLSCAPAAHGDAYGRGSSHCIAWYQNQLLLTTCHVRSRIASWDNRSTG